jgi:hypothetical protein
MKVYTPYKSENEIYIANTATSPVSFERVHLFLSADTNNKKTILSYQKSENDEPVGVFISPELPFITYCEYLGQPNAIIYKDMNSNGLCEILPGYSNPMALSPTGTKNVIEQSLSTIVAEQLHV